jgi:RND family efflux transporter MFP subunit
MKVKKTTSKRRVILIIVAAIAAVLLILFFNKSRMNAKNTEVKFSALPVSVVEMKKEIIKENLSVIGSIVPENEVAVISETQGKVIDLKIKVGSYVTKDSIIAYIEDELKQAAFMTAKASFEKSKKDLERMENLYKEKYISDSDIENARLNLTNAESQFIVARKQFNDTKIKAPINGIVTEKNISIGTMVSPGAQIANIVDISRFKIKINLQESDVLKIRENDAVLIKSDLYPGKTFRGRIESISVKGDSAHAFPVEVILPNERNQLKSGMTVRIEFTSIGEREAYLIPRAALVGSVKNPQVYIVQGNKAKLKDIVIGNEHQTDIVVISGLDKNDKVVVSGQNNLNDNTDVVVQ